MWDTVIKTVLTCLVTLIVTLLFNGIIGLPKKRKKLEEEAAKAKAEEKKELNDKLDSIINDINLCKHADQVILKNSLKVRYDYWIDLGYAPEDAKDDLEREYQVYHNMGKNGVMDSRRAKFLALPNDLPD